jgi:hypothetical protein
MPVCHSDDLFMMLAKTVDKWIIFMEAINCTLDVKVKLQNWRRLLASCRESWLSR